MSELLFAVAVVGPVLAVAWAASLLSNGRNARLAAARIAGFAAAPTIAVAIAIAAITTFGRLDWLTPMSRDGAAPVSVISSLLMVSVMNAIFGGIVATSLGLPGRR